MFCIYSLYSLFLSLPRLSSSPLSLSLSHSFFASFLSDFRSPAVVGHGRKRRYMQPTQPHLMVFSTSSLKEVPSLHSKVYFRRFIRWLAQQAPVSQAPVHSTQDTMRVVWQMA